ncbi:MAG: amyA [Steroidobacteraceae bacterium]|nr:amyA [Steroidobacteraceae bacterium]
MSDTRSRQWIMTAGSLALAACTSTLQTGYYGTTEPFASEAVYFVLTDRFVDGDSSNNHPEQGGANRTFDRPLRGANGVPDNIGYLGGDFRGLLENAAYIREMGFTAVWMTPIVDNPDEAFTGGFGIGEGFFADRGKTGYHGYWGVNFYRADEHLESPDLHFADFTRRMRADHGLRIVLDIVCNHGSPSYTMPMDQPGFGEIYDANDRLMADHQNLAPGKLDPANPLHSWFHNEPDLAELSNLDDTNPEVMDYLVGAYLQWIDQGASAFRIDTIGQMPQAFWHDFTARIRAAHPGFFMFGEHFDYDASKIAANTWPENGGVSVLDFPGRARMVEVFENPGSDYAQMLDYLHLEDGVYRNPYELMIFYDNHDMTRMKASEDGFIDAHNWLFTSRGIPVVYYGSEMAFMAGNKEHEGNRNYFGPEGIAAARENRIRRALAHIAQIRRDSPALQRGLQLNLDIGRDRATFLRVYEKGGVNQTALVMLNKGGADARFVIDRWMSAGLWRDASSGEQVEVKGSRVPFELAVTAHGVRVLLLDARNNDPQLIAELRRAMKARVAGSDRHLAAAGGAHD